MSAASREPPKSTRAPKLQEPEARAPSLDDVAARVQDELWAPLLRERGKLVVSFLVLILLSSAHLARFGTLRMRVVAFVVAALGVVAPIAVEVVRRRRARDARRTLLGAAFALGRVDVLRAVSGLSLAERVASAKGNEGVSPTLARLHAERSIARLDLARLEPIGERRGRLGRFVALGAFLLGTLVIVIAPARVIEGADVALSRKGRAPLTLAWLDEPSVVVHPPAYLHQEDYGLTHYGLVQAFRGSALIVRGTPRRSGRVLVLADDVHEVPFIDDGSGGVVAHWSVAISGKLRVRARFGDVVIEEPTSWDLVCIEDLPPVVELDGAPKTIDLAEAGSSIPLRYDAFDDHGLREVHLVLRIGNREDRRVLAKLEGEPKHDRGGYSLRTNDPMIKKARVPIAIRVEARDNDPITGPKWGRSAEVLLVPPVVGAGEAARYEALRSQRDLVVDLLALAIDEKTPSLAGAIELSGKWEAVETSLDGFLLSAFNGARVPPRLALVLRGRMRKIRDAIAAEVKAPNSATHAASTQLIEKLTIGLDEAMHALGVRDARAIAKTLSQVADDGADGTRELSKATPEKQADAKGRQDVDVKVLDGGGGSMRRLGDLGRDLGEIVENDLRRVDRAMKNDGKAPDLFHAELALRDLAARLREPVPSFGGATNPSAPGDPSGEAGDEDESDAERDAASEESALEELAKEHGGAIGQVEDLLRDAEDPQALQDLKEEAKKHADELRDAVAKLPKNGGMRKTLEAAESSLREKAEAMAQAMESLQMGDARERGDTAVKSAEEAKDKAWIQPGSEEQLDEIEREIEKQNDWIDDILQKLRAEAEKKASEKVKGVAPREKGLSDKAKELGDDSEKKAPLPQDVKDLLDQAQKKMDEAGKKLEEGDSNEGLKLQREAQKLLERARDLAKGEDEQQGQGDNGNQQNPDEKLDIPKAEDHKGPEAFRKRVLEGLSGGSASQKLSEAIKRYAQGLIQ